MSEYTTGQLYVMQIVNNCVAIAHYGTGLIAVGALAQQMFLKGNDSLRFFKLSMIALTLHALIPQAPIFHMVFGLYR